MRLQALIERRRAAPDEGPQAARRAQLAAELDAQRRIVERSRRERSERESRMTRLAEAIQRDESLLAPIARLIASVRAVGDGIDHQRQRFEQALAEDREAGEKVALELRSCAQQEAELQGRLQRENEALTQVEVQAQRARDQASDVENELEALSSRLGLESGPAEVELQDDERAGLRQRIERLARRREQLGPVNPLAQEESVLRTFTRLYERFEADRHLVAENRLVEIRYEDLVRDPLPQVEAIYDRLELGDFAPARGPLTTYLEVTPAGKEMKRLSLLSGGEKSMTALAFLFAVFLARPCPFYILDEVEAALDDLNIDRFLDLLRSYSERAQFIVVTHQKRTMEAADSLYGVSMGTDGISKVISRRLPEERAAA